MKATIAIAKPKIFFSLLSFLANIPARNAVIVEVITARPPRKPLAIKPAKVSL